MRTGFALFVDMAPAMVAILIACLVVFYPLRKDRTAASLIAYLAFVSLLLAANTAELYAPPGPITLLFAKLEYLPYSAIPGTWLAFCLNYTGWITKKSRRLKAAAIAAPVMIFATVMTNGWHHLFWKEIAYIEDGPLSVLHATHGPAFWIAFSYNWLCIALGAGIVFFSYFSGKRLFRIQTLWIIAGTLIPGITNLIYVFRLAPGIAKDFTPIGFALSGLFFLAGSYFHGLLWVMPVARGALLQELGVGILAIDRNGRIIDHNSATDRMFAIDELAAGKPASRYPLLAAFLASDELSAGTGERRNAAATLNGRFEMGDMTLIWRMQEQESGRQGRVFVFEDISGQAALEANIQKMKAEFANREKLVSIGQLTAGLAHEINNPLGYLKSDVRSLETLVERKFPASDDKDIKEIVSISGGISEGLDQIGKVVSTLLAFSRQGSTNVPPENFNLHEGIDAMLEIMRVDWRDIAEIRKDYGAIPEIYVRKHEINQVIFNILKNALQAIRELPQQDGRRRLVQIRTGFENGRIWCEIENNGPPIPEAAANRIFDLFFTTKRELLGTGLGLNYSRDIIEHRNHGKLFLASSDPVVFRMELPADSSIKA